MRFTSFRLAVLIVPLVFPAVGRGGFIDLSSSTKLNYGLNINALVTNDEKVTVVLMHSGKTNAIFSHVFTDSTTGTLSLSDAGSYQLLLIAGAQSTTKGIAGESGTAAFDVALSSAPTSSTAIPLPSALGPGAISLTGLAALGARRSFGKLV